jgi:CDP-glucose 4,6-dehydratase
MLVRSYDWKGRKVLVTGASGFKGSWLSATLIGLGAKVYGTTRNQRDPAAAFHILNLDREVVKVDADISDRQEVYDLVNTIEPDVVFHLAAKALVPVSLRDPRRTYEVNIIGTLNIIEACRRLGIVDRLMVCSTDHVFGDVSPDELPPSGFVETDRVSYGGPYDTSKAAMELLVRSHHKTYWHELPGIAITRCANVYGYGDTSQRRVIPLFVRSAVSARVIDLKYRQSGRQFLHVADAIRGYVLVASTMEGRPQKGTAKPEPRTPFTPTFHFAIEDYGPPGEPFIRMEALARLVGSLLDARIQDTNCVDYPPNENRVQALSCEKTRKTLSWEPMKKFEQTLRDLAEWYDAPSGPSQQLKAGRELADVIQDLTT